LEARNVPVVLIGTEPFVDLARITLTAAGLKDFRMAVFGPALGDCTVAEVTSRAAEMAAELETWLARR
jgi:hypothetical protein